MYRTLFVWFSDLEPAYVCKGLAKPPERVWLSLGVYVAVF